MPAMPNGSYAQLPPAAYAHMQPHAAMPPHNYYWPGYSTAPQHAAPPHHAAVNYMHGYARSAPGQLPPAPITLSAPVPRPTPPRAAANGGTPQQQPQRKPDRPSARAAASASEFDVDDQLGDIGSAFDDEEFDFGQHSSSSSRAAAKRSRTAEEELAGDAHASKRARFGQAVFARQQKLGQQPVQQPREGAGEGMLDMQEMAAMAARGQLSQGAMEVRNMLRQLDPAEGLSILAWLVDALSRNVQREGTPQVRFGFFPP